MDLSSDERKKLIAYSETWTVAKSWVNLWEGEKRLERIRGRAQALQNTHQGVLDLDHCADDTAWQKWKDVTSQQARNASARLRVLEKKQARKFHQIQEFLGIIRKAAPALVDSCPSPIVMRTGHEDAEWIAKRIATLIRPFVAEWSGMRLNPGLPPPADGRPIKEDCSQFRWGDLTFKFSRGQTKVVATLWNAHQVDGNWNGLESGKLVKKSANSKKSQRLRDVFRPAKKMHDAWGTLIIELEDQQDARAKRYRLNLL